MLYLKRTRTSFSYKYILTDRFCKFWGRISILGGISPYSRFFQPNLTGSRLLQQVFIPSIARDGNCLDAKEVILLPMNALMLGHGSRVSNFSARSSLLSKGIYSSPSYFYDLATFSSSHLSPFPHLSPGTPSPLHSFKVFWLILVRFVLNNLKICSKWFGELFWMIWRFFKMIWRVVLNDLKNCFQRSPHGLLKWSSL